MTMEKELTIYVEDKIREIEAWKFLRRIPYLRNELKRPPDEHDYEMLLEGLARILRGKRE